MIPATRRSRAILIGLSVLIAALLIGALAMKPHGWLLLRELFEPRDQYTGAVATRIARLAADPDTASLSFSPDGALLAASSPLAPEVQVWDWSRDRPAARTLHLASGTGLATMRNVLAFSPDGRWLAAGHGRATQAEGYGVIRIWDARTGERVEDLSEPLEGPIRMGLAFSPDGQFLIYTSDRGEHTPGDHLIVQHTGTWQFEWGLRTDPFYPHTVAISADGKWAAIGGERSEPHMVQRPQIDIIDLASHELVRTIDAFPAQSEIERLAWNRDGTRLAAAARPTLEGAELSGAAIATFAAATGERLSEQLTEAPHVSALLYSGDGRYLIEAGPDRTVQIWDAAHQRLLQRIGLDAKAAAISADSRFLAIASGDALTVWQLR
jgi:Tol biopolymer transport system component